MKKRYADYLSAFVFLFLIVGFISSCRPDSSQDIVVGQAKDEFNESDQTIIGNAVSDIINDSSYGFEVLDEANYQELYSHLNTLMGQIVNTVTVQRREDFDWKISVLKDDDEVNAFILPGGHLFIYSGFLKYLEGEHELVGMIAHEVAYADSDMLMDRLNNEIGSKDLSKVLSNDNGSASIASDIATMLKDIVYLEDEILSADLFCTDIICEFVWDGEGILSVLKRGGQDADGIQWLDAKPVSDDRLKQLTNSIYNQTTTCGTPDSTFHQRYIDKIIYNLP